MDSPLARVILTILGGCIIILLVLSGYDWIVEEYPRRPAIPPSSERIRYPFYHEEAVKALQRFSGLPKLEKAAIEANLTTSLISMEQWLAHLEQSDYKIMCMGELHEESTRNFLAEEFFAKFSTDVLLLETTPKNLNELGVKKKRLCHPRHPFAASSNLRVISPAKPANSEKVSYFDGFPLLNNFLFQSGSNSSSFFDPCRSAANFLLLYMIEQRT